MFPNLQEHVEPPTKTSCYRRKSSTSQVMFHVYMNTWTSALPEKVLVVRRNSSPHAHQPCLRPAGHALAPTPSSAKPWNGSASTRGQSDKRPPRRGRRCPSRDPWITTTAEDETAVRWAHRSRSCGHLTGMTLDPFRL